VSARFPVGPLADAMSTTRPGVLLDLGCTPAATTRYLHRGIPVGAAEVLADQAGLDVREVWPYWDEVLAEAEQDRARRNAGAGELLARARRPQHSVERAS
jgi:hypothetical protein